MFATTTGSIRFELDDGTQTERWLVTVEKGEVTVSHGRGKADCTVRATKQQFDGVARGEVNAMAAVLRGEVTVEGDSAMLTRFQRLFPGPPSAVREARQS